MTTAETVSLGHIVDDSGGVIQTGPFGSQLHASDYRVEGTPIIMPVNMGDNVINERGIARVGNRDARRLAKHRLQAGDIVFSRRGDVGRRAIVKPEQDGWLCGTGCLAVKLGKRRAGVNPDYIALYVGSKAAQTWLADNAVGGTMPNLNTSILSALPILLPERAIQDAVVDALQTTYQQEDALRRLISKKKNLQRGVMQELLTGRRRLPGFKSAWRSGALADVAEVDPETLSPATTAPTVDIDYIALEDVSRGALLGSRRYRFGMAPSRARRKLAAQDVLFGTVRPNLQSHTIYRGGLLVPVASTGFAVIRSRRGISDSEFLGHWVMSGLVLAQVERIIAGSNYPAISSADVRRLGIEYPDIVEQRAIGRVLSDGSEEIASLERRLESTRAIKTGMMQELLTGRTRLPVEVAS
jgi:type I restriction enzyme S subunit